MLTIQDVLTNAELEQVATANHDTCRCLLNEEAIVSEVDMSFEVSVVTSSRHGSESKCFAFCCLATARTYACHLYRRDHHRMCATRRKLST